MSRDTLEEKEQVIKEINSFFRRKKAFYLCCVVNAPYDGCFHEPNVFLVCPEGNKNGFEGDLVKGLYATGQGQGVCKLESKKEIIEMVRSEHVPNESSWKSIDSFTTGDASKPINEVTPVHEHYWAQAILVASEEHEISLLWKCDKCNHEIEGDYYEGRPTFTGYRGNGGIGVFMTGALCDDCVQNGLCRKCGRDGDPTEMYDPDIAENGHCLCEQCTEELLDGAIKGEISLTGGVRVEWYKNEKQLTLPGFKAMPVLRVVDDKEHVIDGLEIDLDQLQENIQSNFKYSGLLDAEYGGMVFLKGEYVETIASKNMD